MEVATVVRARVHTILSGHSADVLVGMPREVHINPVLGKQLFNLCIGVVDVLNWAVGSSYDPRAIFSAQVSLFKVIFKPAEVLTISSEVTSYDMTR